MPIKFYRFLKGWVKTTDSFGKEDKYEIIKPFSYSENDIFVPVTFLNYKGIEETQFVPLIHIEIEKVSQLNDFVYEMNLHRYHF